MRNVQTSTLMIAALILVSLGACAGNKVEDVVVDLALSTVVAPNIGNKTRQEVVPGESIVCDQACELRKQMLLASQKEEIERQQRRRESTEFQQDFDDYMAASIPAKADQQASTVE